MALSDHWGMTSQTSSALKVAIFSIIMFFSIILTLLASSIYARHNLAKSSIISLVFSIILNRGLNRENKKKKYKKMCRQL